MTKQWYIENGFKLSPYVEDAEIARAEHTVTVAYISPIVGSATVSGEILNLCVANFAFLYLLQKSIFLTRAGAKTKTGYNSQAADTWAQLEQAATDCHLMLEQLRLQPGVNAKAEVRDVCKIYFKSNFISF